jgi:hypothetical protein
MARRFICLFRGFHQLFVPAADVIDHREMLGAVGLDVCYGVQFVPCQIQVQDKSHQGGKKSKTQ